MNRSQSTYDELMAERDKIVSDIAGLQKGLLSLDWVIRRMFPAAFDSNGAASTMVGRVEQAMQTLRTASIGDLVRVLVESGVMPSDDRKHYNRVATILSTSPLYERMDRGVYRYVGDQPENGRAEEEELENGRAEEEELENEPPKVTRLLLPNN